MPFWAMVFRLIVALALGSLIGLERETHGRPAGLRTHILVCVGSTLFTICSFVIAGRNYDPGRVAAQIVTGVGFLGAGTIIHQGSVVRGLTTAASIWAVAAIGLAVGIGGQMMYLAAVASALVFGTLFLMGRVDRCLSGGRDIRQLTVTTSRDPEALREILGMQQARNAVVRTIDSRESEDGQVQVSTLRIHAGADFDESGLASDLASSKYVISYTWE